MISFSSEERHRLALSERQSVMVIESCWFTILSNIWYVEFHLVTTSCINLSSGRFSCFCIDQSFSDAFVLQWKYETMS